MKRIISQVNRLTPWSKLVGARRPAISVRQLRRNRFAPPVRTMTPRRVAADTTFAPMKQMLRQVERVARRRRASRVLREFLDRHGFAGQRRLVDEQILGASAGAGRPGSCRRPKAGRCRRERAARSGFRRRVRQAPAGGSAPHAGGGVDHRAQPRGGLVGAMFLDEGGDDRQHDHRADDDGRADIAEEIGRDRQRRQQGVQRIARALPDFLEDRELALARDAIGTELLQATSASSPEMPSGDDFSRANTASASRPLTPATRRQLWRGGARRFWRVLAPDKIFIASSAGRPRPSGSSIGPNMTAAALIPISPQ